VPLQPTSVYYMSTGVGGCCSCPSGPARTPLSHQCIHQCRLRLTSHIVILFEVSLICCCPCSPRPARNYLPDQCHLSVASRRTSVYHIRLLICCCPCPSRPARTPLPDQYHLSVASRRRSLHHINGYGRVLFLPFTSHTHSSVTSVIDQCRLTSHIIIPYEVSLICGCPCSSRPARTPLPDQCHLRPTSVTFDDQLLVRSPL
jgi:hypothetical protein